jgi:membrane peptidoglycan carboxypeptidase
MVAAVWFGNRTTNTLRAGFGGPTSGPIWRQFMRDALADQPNIPLPDRATNQVCNRPGRVVNQDGGRGEAQAAAASTPNQKEQPRVSVVTTTTLPGSPGATTTLAPTGPGGESGRRARKP